MNSSFGNTIIFFGIVVVVAGILTNILGRFGLPKLPGDILIQREGFTFYFPVVTSIIVSVILTLILNLLGRR